jgi:hypothetical protein
LCRAAYFQSAPNHNYGRAFKCSKEETMGLLAAVRQWYKRDHAADQRAWLSWLQHIESRVQDLPSVTTEYLQPVDLSNRSPRLRIHWDAGTLGITGTELAARLDAGTPRIVVHDSSGVRPSQMASSLIIMPYMMEAGEEPIIADAIYDGLTQPGRYEDPVLPSSAPIAVEGTWAVAIQYLRGVGEQRFTLQQRGNELSGTQQGELYSAALKGAIHGGQIDLRSTMEVPGNFIEFHFQGNAQGNTMTGTVDLGEYGKAAWEAIRNHD